MKKKQLGKSNLIVSAIGMGCMPMSTFPQRPSETQAIQIIHHALSLGVRLFNTSDAYCLDESEKHHNEQLIYKALQNYEGDTSDLVIVTKGGFTRPRGEWVPNGNPDYLRQTIQESFKALGGEKPIDLWIYHYPDPSYDIRHSLQAAKNAVAEGLIRFIGVSNCSVEQLNRANEVVDIVAVENQFNLWWRDPEFDGILNHCQQQGLAFLPWSPFGGVSGRRRTNKLEDITILFKLAEEKQVSIYCIILAWLQSKSPSIIPIPGAEKPEHIEDCLQALTVKLSPKEIEQINQAMPFPITKRAKKTVKHIMRQLKEVF